MVINNGLIIQWGRYERDGSYSIATIQIPISLNKIGYVACMRIAEDPSEYSYTIGYIQSSIFKIYQTKQGTSAYRYCVIGY